MARTDQPAPCPRCHKRAGIPIFYGMPAGPPDYIVEAGDETFADSSPLEQRFERRIHVYLTEHGERASGGCVFSPERWRCKGCGHKW